MTNILDIHRTGGRRRGPQARRHGEPRPRWTAPETASEADGSVTVLQAPRYEAGNAGGSDAAVPDASEPGPGPSGSRGAPAFRRLVVFGSVDATARRPVA